MTKIKIKGTQMTITAEQLAAAMKKTPADREASGVKFGPMGLGGTV